MHRISWEDIHAEGGYYLNRFQIDCGYQYPLHDHREHWEFVYVSSGSFRHEINGKRLDHGEGLIVLIRDRDVHSLRGDRFSYVNLAFPPAWLDRLENFAGTPGLRAGLDAAADSPRGYVPPGERPALEAYFDRLLRISGEPDAGLAFARTLLDLIGRCRFDRADHSSGSAAGKTARPWLAELIAWAEREGGRPESREFCRKSGYSREHVIRETRRTLGMTPTEFLQGLRLKRARDLLQYTNYPVERIARETGWESLRTFQRRFAEDAGCPPSEYRRRRSLLAH